MVAEVDRPPTAARTCALPSRQEACPFAEQASEPEGCQDPGLRSLLVPYALSGCSEDQEIAFESHVLVCDPCFQDLIALDRASNLLTEFLAEK